jgi:uncharacterized membrane protein YfcA
MDAMTDALTLMIVTATFLLAGSVKGVIGLGLPTVSLGLLTAALDLTTAMALMILPSLFTNSWQAVVGGNGKIILQRIWVFLLVATLAIWLGAKALILVDLFLLSVLLGLLLVAYSVFNLMGFRFTIAPNREKWAGPFFGVVNGILTGMTGSFVVPGVMYLQAIGLPRDQLVQAMGMLFSTSTIALAIALQKHSFLTTELATISLFAVIPAMVGMIIGQRFRVSLSEARFRQLFFISIFGLGCFIIVKSIMLSD